MLQDTLRVLAATAMLIVAGFAAQMIGPRMIIDNRWSALQRLGEIGFACIVALWPALVLTNALSSSERQTMLKTIFPTRT